MQITHIKPTFGIVIFFLLIVAVQAVQAQTSGASYVSSIESKAREILNLEKETEQLKQQILQLKNKKQESIAEAQRNLDAAILRTKNEISWKNRLNTAQGGWEEKSAGTCGAGGPPPLCPVDHWFKTDVATSMAKYQIYLDDYLEPYIEAVKKAGQAEQNKIDQKTANIDRNIQELPNLRKQLVDLSKRYETHMKQEADKIAKNLASELVNLLSVIHQTEESIEAYQKKIAENDQQEQVKKNDAIIKVKKQLEGLQKKLELDIVQLELNYKREIIGYETRIAQYEVNLKNLRDKLRTVEVQLRDFKGTEAQKLVIKNQHDGILQEISNEERNIATMQSKIKQAREDLFIETTMVRNELFKLKTNQSASMIAAATKIVEEAFAQKRELLLKAKFNAEQNLILLNKDYKLNLDEKGNSFVAWTNKVDAERRRVMTACQSVSCACFGTYVVTEANTSWNLAKGCLISINRVRRTTASYYGCEELMSYYLILQRGHDGGTSTAEHHEIYQRRIKTRLQNLNSF